MGYVAGTRTYGQLQAGFDRKFARTGLASKKDMDSDDSGGEDSDEDINDRQTCHSGRIGRNRYRQMGLRFSAELNSKL